MNRGKSTSPINQSFTYDYSLIDMNSLVPFTPTHHHQASEMNTPVPPGFGQQQGENSYSQFPGYQMSSCVPGQVTTAISTRGSQMHHHLGYSVEQNVIEPFNNQGFMTTAYNSMAYVQPQVNQLEDQGPSQQIQVERDGGDGHLVVELEHSNLPMTTPRIRWTPELHSRFDDAVKELGDYFEAKPVDIMRKMNVSGITRNQVKSYLQKIRNKVLCTQSHEGMAGGSAEEMVGSAHQDNTTIQTQKVSEGVEAYTSFRPNFQSPINVQDERLSRTVETPNDNESVALVEDPAANFSFKDYDWAPNHNLDYFEDSGFPAMMPNPYGYQNLGSTLRGDDAPFSDFTDLEFSFPGPHD